MHVAFIGGTGAIGTALLRRFGRDTRVALTVGSRDAERADECAGAVRRELRRLGVDRSIRSGTNAFAASDADVVVLAVPPFVVGETVDSIAPALDPGTVLVSPAVGMTGGPGGLRYDPPATGSVAELAAERAPEGVPVVVAFTNVPAGRLADLDEPVDMDTLVVGDSDAAKATVFECIAPLRGLHAIDAGPLSNAALIESLTPLLITLTRHDDVLAEPGVKFV